MRKQWEKRTAAVLVWATVGAGLWAQPVELRSYSDESLRYPVRVVEAEPYLRPGHNTGSEGNFKIVYRELGTLPAQRLRLPVPGSTWRLDGKVGRTDDGTIYAAFGTYLYASTDEGRTWSGQSLRGLPHIGNERSAALAFGVSGEYILAVHRAGALPPVGVYQERNPADLRQDRNIYPLVVSRSRDGAKSWEASNPLKHPDYQALAGDGNALVQLGNGTLLTALDAFNPQMESGRSGRSAQIFFRSTDEGKSWGDSSLLPDLAAETGLLGLGGAAGAGGHSRRPQLTAGR